MYLRLSSVQPASVIESASHKSCSLHSNRAVCPSALKTGNPDGFHILIPTESIVLCLKDQRDIQKKMTQLYLALVQYTCFSSIANNI